MAEVRLELVSDLEVPCHALTLLAKVSRGAEHEGEVGIGSGPEEHAGLGDGRVASEIRGGDIVAVDAAAAFAVKLVFPGTAQVPAEGLILLKVETGAGAHAARVDVIELKLLAADRAVVSPQVAPEVFGVYVSCHVIRHIPHVAESAMGGEVGSAAIPVCRLSVSLDIMALPVTNHETVADGALGVQPLQEIPVQEDLRQGADAVVVVMPLAVVESI